MANQRRPRRANRSGRRRIKVDDAAALIAGIQSWAAPPQQRRFTTGDEWIGGVAFHMLDAYTDSQVVLRVDDEFVGALMNSDTDVELVPDWLARFPFNAAAYSLTRPLSLHDGVQLCRYQGMLAVGTKTGHAYGDTEHIGDVAVSNVFTRYGPIPTADGVRCLWQFRVDGDPAPRLQTVSLSLRGMHAKGGSLDALVAAQIAMASGGASGGAATLGEELPVLVPLSLMLLLYTAAPDPEIDWPPQEQIARLSHIRDARIGTLGWRTGAALRRWRTAPAGHGGPPDSTEVGGWRLPPHIRKAHWHRVRIAERDETGAVAGSRTGVEGVDWHYEVRWYPPTPVNADDGVAPVVRVL